MQIGCTFEVVAKTVQIRNVPDEVHKTLRVRAAEAGLSLSDYVLKEMVRLSRRPPIADVLQRASERPGGASIKEIVSAVRSGRDRR